jgi:hypothetical protein
MIINKADKFNFLSAETTSTLGSNGSNTSEKSIGCCFTFQGDIFVGHLATQFQHQI